MGYVKYNNPIWNKARRSNVFSKALYAVGEMAVQDIADNQDQSVPAGRTYRRAPIVRTASKRNSVKGLRFTTKRGKSARVVGYRFHKASAYGQPPAKDTKTLYKGTQLRRLAAFRVRIYNDVSYAKYLEPPAKLNRPFFFSVLQKNRPKYVDRIRQARDELVGK